MEIFPHSQSARHSPSKKVKIKESSKPDLFFASKPKNHLQPNKNVEKLIIWMK